MLDIAYKPCLNLLIRLAITSKRNSTLNYIGSKLKLLNFIHDTISNTVPDLKQKTFCDLFAGSGVVGSFFRPLVKGVMANDMEFYSYVLNKHYLCTTESDHDLIQYLNQVTPTEGFVFNHYAAMGAGGRQFFSAANAQKIDAIRTELESMRSAHAISDNSYYFALASLLESADKVANTTSVYGAYLKHIKTSALKDFVLKSAKFNPSDESQKNTVYNEDAGVLISGISGDILYLDPPYNQRQYGANYHLLNTIAKYDTDDFKPVGVTGLRPYQRSDYCRKKLAVNALDALISKAQFTYIFLSYNDEGIIHPDEIAAIMSRYGHYSLSAQEYKRFRADNSTNRTYKTGQPMEHIHILKKD